MKKPAIFLDRDGVIIENKDDYVRSWSDVKYYSQAVKALSDFYDVNYYFVIITNQSVIGRGLIPEWEIATINSQMIDGIHGAGGRIDASYMCPHAPGDNCKCRKPESGMILQAAKDLDIDLKNSIMIGDALTDIKAGHRAGIKKLGMVLTGRGEKQFKIKSSLPYSAHKNLHSALSYFLNN